MTEEVMRCTIDFETSSFADLGLVGQWEYSRHPTTVVICLCYRMSIWEPGRVDYWVPDHGDTCPTDLSWAIRGGCLVEAHNYAFECAIWTNIMAKRHGWPSIFPQQWRCSMAVACYYALPAKLESLLRALGLPGKMRRVGG